jgi:hypothetical protein
VLLGTGVRPVAALVLLVILPMFSSTLHFQARAEQGIPCAGDYSQLTQDGEYLFVMLARDEISRDNPGRCVRRDEEIRGRYDASGLYPTEGPPVPMWTVDWYARAVTVSGDGRHLVRWGPLAPAGDFTAPALTFYDNGREIASYPVDQLVNFPFMLPVIEGHYTWVHDFALEDTSARLTLATELGEHYVFDIATGQAVSNWVPPLPRYLLAAGAAITLVVSIATLAYMAWRRPRVPSTEPLLRRKPG